MPRDWVLKAVLEEELGQATVERLEEFIRDVIQEVQEEAEDPRVREGDNQQEVRGY